MAKYIYYLFSAIVLVSCGSSQKISKKNSYMQSMYNDIKNEIPEAQVTLTHDSLRVLFPEHLLFDFDSEVIKVESQSILSRLSDMLVKYKKTGVLINGYTDNTGSDNYNKTLSQKRANSAEAVLLNHKIAPVRLYAWGHGKNNPIANNSTEEGRAKNRRVEFVIMYKYTPTKSNSDI